MAADDTKLQIGDEFALQTIPAGEAGVDPVVGFVAASKSGGLDGSCFVDFLDGSDMEHANSPMPHNCRFKLHTTNQYAAWRRLFKFRNAASGLEPDPELEAQLLAEVQAEAKVNTTEFALRTGHVVRFGQVLQILSPVADAYLCTSKLIAEEDTSSLRCSLLPRDERSKQVWFRILPGYRTRNEGEPVSMGDTIILQSIKAEHMYLSCRHKGAPPLSRREVHISTTYTRFRVVPVANFHDCGRGQQFVRGGDYVQIYHRQLQSYLHRDEQGRPRLLRPHRLQKADKARAVRADLVWQIESPCMKWGGSTLRASEKRAYSLKDTVSGHFLHELQDGSVSFEPGDDTNMAQWVLLPFDDEVDEMTVETAEFLLQNKGTGRVLHHIQESEATVEGGGALFSLRGTDENVENEDELFVFRTFTEEWLMQLRFVQVLCQALLCPPAVKHVLTRHAMGLGAGGDGTAANVSLGNADWFCVRAAGGRRQPRRDCADPQDAETGGVGRREGEDRPEKAMHSPASKSSYGAEEMVAARPGESQRLFVDWYSAGHPRKVCVEAGDRLN
jgi:hypothetical protein